MIHHFSGNSAYCYANSLYMFLYALKDQLPVLPEPGFLECLTLMPFGKCSFQGLFYPNLPGLDPDKGLKVAFQTLGISSQEQFGGTAEQALERLHVAAQTAPVLVGPLDIGHLTYIPGHEHLIGSDHYGVVLTVNRDHLCLHDPAGYPYATVPVDDFVVAWQAENIIYGRKPFMMWSDLQLVDPVGLSQLIMRTLQALHDHLETHGDKTAAHQGGNALRSLALSLRGDVTPKMSAHLLYFALPVAMRRLSDAAEFMEAAGKREIAQDMVQQAKLFSDLFYHAVHRRWEIMAGIVEQIASIEDVLVAKLW
jgi:hypothetical protein